ncbi:type III-A CRISPR-associated protein Cas10/Csm1 [Synergistales bacterium]|nr:type III-A CRISPR-associated protein Cas10/Csm1 [Synergistales bacterium]
MISDAVTALTAGALLHDIGKICYRAGDGRAHSISGAEFLRGIDERLAFGKEVIGCVRWHHAKELAGAGLEGSSLAYICYMADNIAAGADRRDTDDRSVEEGAAWAGFDRSLPLGSVFNLLNGSNKKFSYPAGTLEHINYPDETEKSYTKEYYAKILADIKYGIGATICSAEYLGSLLDLLEGYLTFVPSSTNVSEQPDISLFDHVKITAAAAAAIYLYFEERAVTDYKSALFDRGNAEKFYAEDVFLLFSFDISGIQDFIYTISGTDALKSLRARSFYLEIMAEHMADEILSDIGLSRASLLYSGGGHAYILLPGTKAVKSALAGLERRFNDWFMENFGTSLYVACAYTECSANDLMKDAGSAYRDVSDKLSAKKLTRYTADDIRRLNALSAQADQTGGDNGRECRECKRSDNLTDDGICRTCASLAEISRELIKEDVLFVVGSESGGTSLPLPGGKHLRVLHESKVKSLLSDGKKLRVYSKNKMRTGLGMSANLWMGEYSIGLDFESIAGNADGIKRLAVLRADVDNLGRTFCSGFRSPYNTISRTAALSRQLSMFFKYHINDILSRGTYSLGGDAPAPRSAVIVYSGGDDLFIVGAWNECVEFALDLTEAFSRYTQGTLTLSAGIGMFGHSHPVKRMAEDSGELEDAAKNKDEEKDKLALFRAESVYPWAEFRNGVLGEKLREVQAFFDSSNEHGKAFIYKLLEYLRNIGIGGGGEINLARLAYTLARLAPEDEDKQKAYGAFSQKVYGWAIKPDERHKLMVALELYVYLTRVVTREKEEK